MRGGLLCFSIAVIASVTLTSCSGRQNRLVDRATSPDHTHALETWADFSIESTPYEVHLGGNGSENVIVASLPQSFRRTDRLFATWRSPHEVVIGAPLELTTLIHQPSHAGIHVTVIPYPEAKDAYAILAAAGGLEKLSPAQWSDLKQSRDVVDSLLQATKYRANVTPKFDVSESVQSDTSICELTATFLAVPLRGAGQVVVRAEITRRHALYMVYLRPDGISGLQVSAMMATSAQFRGHVFVSDPLAIQSDGSGDLGFLWLKSPEFREFLADLRQPPFVVLFLWDFPDVAAAYTAEAGLPDDEFHRFTRCVSQASPSDGLELTAASPAAKDPTSALGHANVSSAASQ